jgi:hypothetical protein
MIKIELCYSYCLTKTCSEWRRCTSQSNCLCTRSWCIIAVAYTASLILHCLILSQVTLYECPNDHPRNVSAFTFASYLTSWLMPASTKRVEATIKFFSGPFSLEYSSKIRRRNAWQQTPIDAVIYPTRTGFWVKTFGVFHRQRARLVCWKGTCEEDLATVNAARLIFWNVILFQHNPPSPRTHCLFVPACREIQISVAEETGHLHSQPLTNSLFHFFVIVESTTCQEFVWRPKQGHDYRVDSSGVPSEKNTTLLLCAERVALRWRFHLATDDRVGSREYPLVVVATSCSWRSRRLMRPVAWLLQLTVRMP